MANDGKLVSRLRNGGRITTDTLERIRTFMSIHNGRDYISGKEISFEDIRLALEKMPDRLYEHPSTVLVLTNMYYSEAPWLTVKSTAAANSLVSNEVALSGNTSHDFEEQITGLQDFLSES